MVGGEGGCESAHTPTNWEKQQNDAFLVIFLSSDNCQGYLEDNVIETLNCLTPIAGQQDCIHSP